ncbi:GPR endopeptidase [Clostridia bacterium]|jgi:spore protease
MQFRTDLAIEVADEAQHLTDEDVGKDTFREGDTCVTRLHIRTDRAARALGKPQGAYITVEVPPLTDNEETLGKAAGLVANELTALLPAEGSVLVVGLGNRAITPDALGPESADMVLATRHIGGEFARSVGLDDLRPTAVLTPGVLGQTGTESGEIVRGVCTVVHPVAVVVVDALAARSVARLGCTVQLCDTGIAPGSGVGNNRQPLNAETLGVPVIGMGVPTVVDAATIAREFSDRGEEAPDLTPRGAQMMVTPREVDVMIHRAARLVAMAINGALQPDYNPLELIAVAKG